MIRFEKMATLDFAAKVTRMMESLYDEDSADFKGVQKEKFINTLRTFIAEPTAGSALLMVRGNSLSEDSITGYALIVPYWSNEFGGRLLFVDELFVTPANRNQGIAKEFFKYLHTTRPYGAVACALETSPSNTRSRALYESIGFLPRSNKMLVNYWG